MNGAVAVLIGGFAVGAVAGAITAPLLMPGTGLMFAWITIPTMGTVGILLAFLVMARLRNSSKETD